MMDFNNEISTTHYVSHMDYTDLNLHRHMHLNYEVLFVYEGEITVTLNNTPYELHEKDAIMILPEQNHAIETKSETSRCYACVFSADNVEEFTFFTKDRELGNPVFTLGEFSTIELFRSARNNHFIEKSFLYLICGVVARGGVRKFEKEENEDDHLAFKIIKYISDNHLNKITLHDMADALDYNYTYLSNYFNKHFKTGFSATVNGYRVTRAKKLLLDHKRSMAQIANECGFGTVRNFNRVFLQFEKVSPTDYRESNALIGEDIEENEIEFIDCEDILIEGDIEFIDCEENEPTTED